MNKETLDQIQRIKDGMNGDNEDTAIAADTLKRLGLEYPETINEREVTERYEDMLNECYESITIGYETVEAAEIYRDLRPQLYQMGLHEYMSNDYIESESKPDHYYSSGELEELRDNESSVLFEVKSHLLEAMDEDTEDYALIDDAKDFDALLKNCHSLHSKAEIQKEVSPWEGRPSKATVEQGGDTDVQDQRRTRRM